MLRIRSASLIGFFQRLLLSFVFPRRGTSIHPLRLFLYGVSWTRIYMHVPVLHFVVGDAIGPSVARYEP
jgi:hypothetical protein